MTDEELLTSTALEVARAALSYSLPKIPSTTLRNGVVVEAYGPPGGARLRLPYYWATYVHFGRGAIDSQSLMVYFRDPSDDPRISQGYPRQRNQIRRLTKSQWDHGLAMNKIARASGQEEPMVVVRAVKGTSKYAMGGPHPSLFWSNSGGMSGFSKVGNAIVLKALGKEIRKRLVTGNV